MLSSAKKVCFLNKKWYSLFALFQRSKQIFNLIISHFGDGTNHSFGNETPSHLGAFSSRSTMKCIIKYSGVCRWNSVQQIPGAKIIIYFPSKVSTRLKTARMILFLSSGRVKDGSQSYLLDKKNWKKRKKTPEFAAWMGHAWWQMWCAGSIWHFLLSDCMYRA